VRRRHHRLRQFHRFHAAPGSGGRGPGAGDAAP
jgi:hypothetical protein